MSLLHQGLLWLLPLAAIPIVLHLLVWPRLRTVELPTFRFLMDSYVYQRRRLRFLEAILAALRVLFLILLVLSFCRPLITPLDGSLFGGGSGRDVVVLLDSSASMNASAGGATSLTRAKNYVKSLTDQLGANDRLTLIRCDSLAQEAFSRYNSDPEATKRLIDEQECSPARGNLWAGWSMAFGSPAVRRDSSQVHVVTDLQSNGWKEIGDQNGLRPLPRGLNLKVVDVGSGRDQGNRAVIGDAPQRSQVIVGLPVELTARIWSESGEGADAGSDANANASNLILHVFINDKETARYPLSLQQGAVVTKRIVWVPTEAGVARGRFEISGGAPDRFPDDDRFQFAIQVSEKVKVVLVNGKPNTRDPFQDEALYLRAALAAPSREERERAERERGQNPSLVADQAREAEESELAQALDVREINEQEIRRREDLDEVSVVILANCRGFDSNRYEWLRDFVRKGGGLIIFPGDRTDINSFNDRFSTVPNESRARFLDFRFEPPQGEVDKLETMERLTGIDSSHPALAAFDDRDARYFRSVAIFRHFPLKPAGDVDIGGNGNGNGPGNRLWTLARMTSGDPALIEQQCGEGVVIVSAIPVSASWTNLPLKPEFVPLALRLIGHARRAPELTAPAIVAPGAIAEIVVAPEWASAFAKVIDPQGRSRSIEFQRDGPKAVAAYDATREAGFYEVEVRQTSVEPLKTAAAGFAVNLDSEESKFAKATEDQIRAWAPDAKLFWEDATAERTRLNGADEPDQTREIWRWLIYGLFVIIGMEFALATLAGSDPSRTVD